MALLKPKELRAMRPDDRKAKLRELDDELMHERGVAAMGGAPASPGKMRAIKKNIARILTIEREAELAGKRPAEAPEKKTEKKKSAAPKRRPERADQEAGDSDTESLDGEDQEEKK